MPYGPLQGCCSPVAPRTPCSAGYFLLLVLLVPLSWTSSATTPWFVRTGVTGQNATTSFAMESTSWQAALALVLSWRSQASSCSPDPQLGRSSGMAFSQPAAGALRKSTCPGGEGGFQSALTWRSPLAFATLPQAPRMPAHVSPHMRITSAHTVPPKRYVTRRV